MVVTEATTQPDQGYLVPLTRKVRGAVLEDLAKLNQVRDWTLYFNPEHDREVVTATARGEQGAYSLIMFRGAVSLTLARDQGDIDLSKLLNEEAVGAEIHDVASSIYNGCLEQKRVLARLPELTARPITYTDNHDCWRVSSGERASYLYYHDGATSIQVKCLTTCDTSPGYQMQMQCSPDAPWIDVTQNVRCSPEAHAGVLALLRAPINNR